MEHTPTNLDEMNRLCLGMLRRYVSPHIRLLEFQERATGPQGFSGARMRYVDVIYEYPEANPKGNSGPRQIQLVFKDAPLIERKTLMWLNSQRHAAVPFSYVEDLDTDAPRLMCQMYAGEQSKTVDDHRAELALKEAQALAAIHAANFQQAQALMWLPKADRPFFEQLVQTCWRAPWQANLRNEVFRDAHSTWLPAADGEFAAQYGHLTAALESMAAHFIDDMVQLWQMGDSLTLVHADLHNQNVLAFQGQPFFVDWGLACYGTLYLDLPNYFEQAHALLYRQALERHGHVIPEVEFIRNYWIAQRYVAFKYLGFTLWLWRAGGPNRSKGLDNLIQLALQKNDFI